MISAFLQKDKYPYRQLGGEQHGTTEENDDCFI